jgi:membrane protease YdiL (CAAX protease family)
MESTKQRQTIEFFLFLTCFFVVWSLRATSLYSIDESITSNQLRLVYSSLIKFAIWVVPAFGFAYWIRDSSPFQYLGLSVLPPVRQWVLYLIIMGLFFSAVIGFETFLGRKTFSMTGITLSITLSGILFYFVTPLIEEILFRGLVMKELLCLLPGLAANITTSLLFAGIHLPFWLSHGGLTEAVLANTAGVFIVSLLTGWLYQRSASIWPSTIAHIANNVIAALLVTKNG